MGIIRGRFEYDVQNQAFYLMPENIDDEMPPFTVVIDEEARQSIKSSQGCIHAPKQCGFWFDAVGSGKNKLVVVSCDVAESFGN